MPRSFKLDSGCPFFVAAALPPAVVRAVEGLVRSRREVPEAHLVAMRESATAPATSALIILSEDSTVSNTLERELHDLLKPHVRPRVVLFSPRHEDLPWVRGLGGELKRDHARFPWWLLFLGI